jgi:hypothetical protein
MAECTLLSLGEIASGRPADELIEALGSVSPRTPMVIQGVPAEALEMAARLNAAGECRLAAPGSDDRFVPDLILDAVWQPFFEAMADSYRRAEQIDPPLRGVLADLVSSRIRPFRQAAATISHGGRPFPRQLRDLRSGVERVARYRASETGVDLRAFLQQNTLLHGALRTLPGGSYRLATRLGYRTEDALRMALRRGLGLRLREIEDISVLEIRSQLSWFRPA